MFYLNRARRSQAEADRAAARADFLTSLIKAAIIFSLIFALWFLLAALFGYSLILPLVGLLFFALLVGPPATVALLYYDHRWRSKSRESIDWNQDAALRGERSWRGLTPY